MRAIVAVPVREEAERIGACLRALALQEGEGAAAIVLVINNSEDATAAIVRELIPTLPTPVVAIEHVFAPEAASAGAARRMAMEHAAVMLGESGVLLTTDADGRVGPDWVAANLHHVRQGADAVAGRAVLDPAEAALIPAALHADDALECAYAATLDRIAAVLDPLPWDKWPRHAEHSGASIAVTLAAYRRAGGMPAAALAEDRRFMAALLRTDARVRHAPEIAVAVSGRTVGRAEGGMADTIRRRLGRPDPYLDDALEPATTAALRARCRAGFRLVWAGARPLPLAGESWVKVVHPAEGSGLLEQPTSPLPSPASGRGSLRRAGVEGEAALAAALGVEVTAVRLACRATYAGEGWAALEAASPALARALVPAREVGRHQAEADALLHSLLAEQALA